jgi:serine phosphatase RsbU (regulator of sigma subunit)
VLYTDGVSEARRAGGDTYGMPRLEALLRTVAGRGAGAIAERVERAAGRAGQHRDDVAVLVGRVRP